MQENLQQCFNLHMQVSLQHYFNLHLQVSLQHCFKLCMQVSFQQCFKWRMQVYLQQCFILCMQLSLQHCFNLQSIFHYIWTIQKLELSILTVSDSQYILFNSTMLFDDASCYIGLVYCELTENITGNIHRAEHVKYMKANILNHG